MTPDTKSIIERTAESLPAKFAAEAERLASCGGFDPDRDAVCTLIRVALENIAQLYDRGSSRAYRNLSKF